MKIDQATRTLAAGTFFGDRCRAIGTPSFQFCAMQATVPERQVPRHTHEAPHFILITNGVYITEARNRSGMCGIHTLIFNPGGTTHRDRFFSSEGRFLSITPMSSASLLAERASTGPLVMVGEKIRLLADPFVGDHILRELHRTDMSSGVLEELGLELMGMLSRVGDGPTRFVPKWALTAREMIEDCFTHDLSVSELAASVGVHPVYLARAYRRHFGYSPGEYLRQCRVLRARDLLLRSNSSLVDIALQAGFSDQSQMTRLFTQVVGMSPGRYHRMRRS